MFSLEDGARSVCPPVSSSRGPEFVLRGCVYVFLTRIAVPPSCVGLRHTLNISGRNRHSTESDYLLQHPRFGTYIYFLAAATIGVLYLCLTEICYNWRGDASSQELP